MASTSYFRRVPALIPGSTGAITSTRSRKAKVAPSHYSGGIKRLQLVLDEQKQKDLRIHVFRGYLQPPRHCQCQQLPSWRNNILAAELSRMKLVAVLLILCGCNPSHVPGKGGEGNAQTIHE